MCIYVCVCVSVCLYVCMYACVGGCVGVCVYVWAICVRLLTLIRMLGWPHCTASMMSSLSCTHESRSEVSSSELKSALSSASSENLKNESCGESLWPKKKIDTVGGGGRG